MSSRHPLVHQKPLPGADRAVLLTGWGIVAVKQTPLDAIPDLSDVQVIVKTSFPGQSPRVVEEQVTYPITTTMLSVPGAKAVRGYSFFRRQLRLRHLRGRHRSVLGALAGAGVPESGRLELPDGVQPRIGPDATGVGWVYSYALVDRTGQHDLAQLTSLQNWFLKFELSTVPGVSEVATVGGMVRQYQIVVDPEKLRAYGIPLARVSEAVRNANREVGGSVLELAEAEYMVRTRGYLTSIEDIELIPVQVTPDGTPICCATSRGCRSARRCAASWRTWTARARSPAASSSCATARTRWPPSPP
jgi:Cu(I)/Ag(I) efflux system membrane protein CusA/SilA